jgi:hypothetical protein
MDLKKNESLSVIARRSPLEHFLPVHAQLGQGFATSWEHIQMTSELIARTCAAYQILVKLP